MRTRGLAIAAVVEILLGLFALIGGVGHLLFGIGGLVSINGTDVVLGTLANALGDIFTIEGLILLVAGTGLWMQKAWGWKLSVGIVIAGIITSIPVLALGSVGAVPALIVNLVLLYFLWSKKVRDSFSRTS
jgi:hypothetical protein